MIFGTLLAIAFIGCGGPSQEEKDAAETARAEAVEANNDAEKLADKAEAKASGFLSCKNQLGDLLQSLASLDSRLSVGLTYADYSTRVGDVRVVYDRVPFGNINFSCLSTGVRAEKALNSYSDAYNTWNACFSDLYCSNDSIDSELQSDWSKAGRQLRSARGSYASLRAQAVNAQTEADDARDEAEKKADVAEEAEAKLEE